MECKLFEGLLLLFVICAVVVRSDVEADKPCRFSDTVNITDGKTDIHGNIHHNGDVYSRLFYATYDYIIKDFVTMEPITVQNHTRGCICKVRDCVRICETGNFSTIVNVTMEKNEFQLIDLAEMNVTIVNGKPRCGKNEFLTILDSESPFTFVRKNLSIMSYEQIYDENKFCFLSTRDPDMQTDAMVCFPSPEEELAHQLYPMGMMISLPFLIITFLVYLYVPEIRNLHGKNLMSYVFSLILLYVSLTMAMLMKDSSPFICQTTGYTIYYSALSSFFWLNVLCFEIWSTIRGGLNAGSKRTETVRYLQFFAYAFGIPALFVIFAILVDKTNVIGNLIPKEYHPMVGIQQDSGITECLISSGDRMVRFLYLYLITSIIMIVNIGLFMWTACTIYSVRKAASTVGKIGDSSCSDTKRFFLYLRLFILMGIVWIMEPISWFIDRNSVIFYLTDFLNCLQGLIIFILFVMRKRVFKSLKKRCGCGTKLDLRSSITSTRTSRFSLTRTLSSKMSSLF